MIPNDLLNVNAYHAVYELRLDSLHERNNIYPSVTVQHYLHQPYTIPVNMHYVSSLISVILIASEPQG